MKAKLLSYCMLDLVVFPLYWRNRRKFTIWCSCLCNKCLGKQISDNTRLIIQLKFGTGIFSRGKSSAWFYCYCKARLIEMLVNVQYWLLSSYIVLSMPDVWLFTFLITLCYHCLQGLNNWSKQRCWSKSDILHPVHVYIARFPCQSLRFQFQYHIIPCQYSFVIFVNIKYIIKKYFY